MAKFSDIQLIQIVTKAARRVNRRLCLFGLAEQIVISSSTGEITSPDDGTFEDLVLLQAECLIASREFQTELSGGAGGVLVKDGEQVLDNRASIVARGTFFNSPHSPCAELDTAIVVTKLARSTGKLIY